MMNNAFEGPARDASIVTLSLLAWNLAGLSAEANPVGGTVTQGAATINSSGTQLTVTSSSANTAINWQTFNVGVGETTTFVEPSSTSVVWNHISDSNPSQLLGNIDANGYVVLQNQNGFVVGGNAAIKAAGLVMTTSASSVPTLSSGGAWQFDSPPPSAKIINYGQITVAGGPVYLIAADIENNGTISAEKGQIGLYDGKEVLVSTSASGLGLSARVTLPAGSVDNEGKLIADGGSIVAQAQTVNNNGLVQANSVKNVNGVVELVASGDLTMGANSDIEVNGDSTASSASPGGFVVLKAGGNYSDTATSQINVTGANGGQDGIIEALGSNLTDGTTLQSQIGGNFALLVNPYDMTISSNPTGTSYDVNNNLNVNFKVGDLATYAQIDLHALDNIELSKAWTLNDPSVNNSGAWGNLSLSAGNNIIFDSGTDLKAGNDWNVNLMAGMAFAASGQSQPDSGSDGIYLNGSAYLQAQNGGLILWAANEVQVGWTGSSLGAGQVNTGTGRITTAAGGSINVTTDYGDINTGSDFNGYLFGQTTAPYYKVSPNVGGISTIAGGNVTLAAGGDVISYLPLQSDYADALHDAGSGAFGPEAGNVTITAGGNVYGHFVVADGAGTVTAGGDIGAPLTTLSYDPGEGFALSLIKGSWKVDALTGSIYVQDVRNPNGIFGEKNAGSSPGDYAGYHVFDYDSLASVSLTAGDSVEITGYDVPHTPASTSDSIPLIFPPSLTVDAGAGGFILDSSVILYPSFDSNGNPTPNQSLTITTHDGGNFGIPNSESAYSTDPVTLEMSDSASKQWTSVQSYNTDDHAATLGTAENASPVEISIAGNMNAVNLYTTKTTEITVAGDMINCGFRGENLSSSDVTSIKVTGNIYNSPLDTFEPLSQDIVGANPNQSTVWDSVFDLALTPSLVSALANLDVNNIPATETLATYLKQNGYLFFPSVAYDYTVYGANPGFIYDPVSKILGFQGVMSERLSAAQIAALEGGTFTVLLADANGHPIVDANGHLETTTYTFNAASVIASLAAASLTSVYNTTVTPIGYQIGGPGQLNVSAASINLGDTPGITSLGINGFPALDSLMPNAATGGASVNVTVEDNLNMITSSIFSEDGGNVTVSAGGEIDLSEGTSGHYFDFKSTAPYGIFTAGHSDVSVTANGNINVGSARIATFDGGNVFVESYNGDVNAGSGVTEALNIYGVYDDPTTGLPTPVEFGDYTDATTLLENPPPYGCGILAEIPTKLYQTGGVSQPGNIVVETPKGNIVSSSGGITQLALNGSINGPSVTLIAGTAGTTSPTDADAGNILLGAGGVIGGEVNVTATGKIQGYFVSKQNLNVTGLSFTGLGLAGQTANVTASEAGSGPAVVVGIGAVNATGLGSGAELIGQNVSANGGAAQSTLGTSANASAASQNAAGVASTDTKQQVASNENGNDDDEKKKQLHPLMQHVKRVTVILPQKS